MPGLILYALCLVAVPLLIPMSWWHGATPAFVVTIGLLGAWRYGWGLLHFCRGLYYRKVAFPRMRRQVEALGVAALPSHVYLLITSFRVGVETTERVYRGAITEAIASGLPCTIVASIVDDSDRRLIGRIYDACARNNVGLILVQIAGTGKRDALAHAFRAIAAERPGADAAVCVIDGDTIIDPGILRSSLPFLKATPNVGAFTTDEVCEVEGNRTFRDWYNLRFAQRHVLMSSMGLSRRVLTLTGRMSAFRSGIVCDPRFIARVEEDHIHHWRFGRLKFLTGDDKSTWYHLLSSGYEMLYIPDVRITTIESPPHPDFGIAATQLMVRWFGNMLRTNSRALALGPDRIGFFTWWSILDQRLSMWTSLAGLTGALLVTVAGAPVLLLGYIYWVALSRFGQTLMLMTVHQRSSWRYPFLLYFNQIYGSAIKTYILFHLDRQKWTRQKTVLAGGKASSEQRWIWLGSHAGHAFSVLLLVVVMGIALGVLSPQDVAVAAVDLTRSVS
ncbi:MAG: glycosyltransferase [Novosphingobium sp.]